MHKLFVKRLLDIVISLMLIILLVPVWIVVPIFIYIYDGKPAFFAKDESVKT